MTIWSSRKRSLELDGVASFCCVLAFWTGGAKQLGLDLWTGATPLLLLQLLEL